MKLKNYLKLISRNEKIAILYFDDNYEIECRTYNYKKDIPIEYLEYEVMDFTYEDDYREVWIKNECN